MTTDEIKKTLYRLPVSAYFVKATKRGLTYAAGIGQTGMGIDSPIIDTKLTFEVPFDDIGDATFEASMPAKHLIRYLVPLQTEQP